MSIYQQEPELYPTNNRIEIEYQLNRLLYIDAEKVAYLAILILAVVSRFWDLGARVMSHDESLHTRYSWLLYRGEGYSHTPLMHGPLLFHMTALNYLLFGANDFTARIYTAILGVLIVMSPWLMRRWLGTTGAIAASFMLLISPLVLYYSRYIREDIPAIFGALMMVLAIWYYVEDRKFSYLILLSLGMAWVFASKEVSFMYVAVFGSFLTFYFLSRLAALPWDKPLAKSIFLASFGMTILSLILVGADLIAQGKLVPAPAATSDILEATAVTPVWLIYASYVLLGVLSVALVVMTAAIAIGQWQNLKRFPELDAMFLMGSLILPALSPFLIQLAQPYTGLSPTDSTPDGIRNSLMFAFPSLIVSVLVGLLWFMTPPEQPASGNPEAPAATPDESDGLERQQPDLLDWVEALLYNRWWILGGVYWLFFLFFFTTMFTNAGGIGTGLIGSLGYWLEQHDIYRGGQPWYYYMFVVMPIYEFLPLLLFVVAGLIGAADLLVSLAVKTSGKSDQVSLRDGTESKNGVASADYAHHTREDTLISLVEPIGFPVLGFTGYWALMMIGALSASGEKMPWLATHLTVPMIILGGWVLGRAIERLNWKVLSRDFNWVILLLIPLFILTLLRAVGPLCAIWPSNLLCNTVVPPEYRAFVFQARTIEEISATYSWIAAVVVLVGSIYGLVVFAERLRVGQLFRLMALVFVTWLAFLTLRASWTANYVNYDRANEFLVYAHSSGAVKDVLTQIEEISLKTTDGYGLRVAYDNKVSWPFSWYMKDYYNAVYYGDQPSRGLIGDAPVILAGPDNWARVESLLGNRYYRFEYIRMWWPMEDYKGLRTFADWRRRTTDLLTDPMLQRGLWEIFVNRNYEVYAEAVMPYRGTQQPPSFDLNEWPVAERMRVYIRKDVYAQVWEYGVAATEVQETLDPYAENVVPLQHDLEFGAGMLNNPHGIAVAADGSILVADTDNHRIVVFNADGEAIRSIGRFGTAVEEGTLNLPWDVDVGQDGTVYVADTWNHRLIVFSEDGEFVRQWGFYGPGLPDSNALWGPRGIAISPENVVLATDTGNKRILSYREDGAFMRQIGSGGSLDGELDEPVGIAIGPDGYIYVADTWNQRIQVFTQDGLLVRSWLVDAWFAQSNERPYLDLDSVGNVIISDPEASRIIAFSSVGEYLYSFGDYETLGLVGGLALGPDDHLYVSSVTSGSIYRFDLSQIPQQTTSSQLQLEE